MIKIEKVYICLNININIIFVLLKLLKIAFNSFPWQRNIFFDEQ